MPSPLRIEEFDDYEYVEKATKSFLLGSRQRCFSRAQIFHSNPIMIKSKTRLATVSCYESP